MNTIAFKNHQPIPVFAVLTNKTAVDLAYNKYVQDGNVQREVMTIYFPPSTDISTLLAIFKDEDALSEITITDQITGNFWVHLSYEIALCLNYENITNESDIEKYESTNWIVMQLAQLTTTDKELRKLIGKKTYDKSYMSVDEYKNYLIMQSKDNLAVYLDKVLMPFENESFKVTLEKQSMFMSKFTTQLTMADTTNFNMIWNASGVVEDQYRDYDWCIRFMQAMNDFVNPLVNGQRVFEAEVKQMTTKQQLDAATVPFQLPQDGDIS